MRATRDGWGPVRLTYGRFANGPQGTPYPYPQGLLVQGLTPLVWRFSDEVAVTQFGRCRAGTSGQGGKMQGLLDQGTLPKGGVAVMPYRRDPRLDSLGREHSASLTSSSQKGPTSGPCFHVLWLLPLLGCRVSCR